MSQRPRLIDFGTRAEPLRAESRQPGARRFFGGRPLLASLASALLLASTVPASAQIGGPIGAPVGVPNALPSGAAGYNANNHGSFTPPVNNWGAGQAGRADDSRFGAGIGTRSIAPNPGYGQPIQVPVPQYPAAGGANGPQQAIDPRHALSNQRQPATRDDEWRGAPTRSVSGGAAGTPTPAARPIAQTAETSRIDVMRDLVQRGQMYETGLGQPKDLNRAFGLYCEAGGSGYPEALVRMGLMYADGNGVEKNADAAATLFRRAARFGSALGADLAKRYPAGAELLPQCLKGTVVEKGTVERPATAAELAAVAQKLDSGLVIRNPALGAERARLVNSVITEARQYKLDPRLVLAVMATESGFDPNAKSNKNAMGLMQLIPETAERFAVRNILDPVENMRGGMAYLRWLLSYFRGDVTLTLAAYNAGEGAVEKHNGVPPFTETVAYVQRIRAIYPHDRHPYDPAAATTASRAAAAIRSTSSQAMGEAAIARN